MAKYKTVKQQEQAKAKEAAEAQRAKEKRKWTRPKDFDFLRPIKFLPGFRTGKHWKRILSLIYYCASPVALFNSLGLFMMVFSAPFMLFSLISVGKTRDKFYMIEFFIALVVFFVGSQLFLSWIQGKMAGVA